MAGNTSPSNTFVLLDGVRGLGAIIVLIGHTIPMWGMVMAESGPIIVDAFFLLSGFVLAFAYEPKFAAGMRVGEFMLHRVVRLFPLYLLGTLLVYATLMLFTFGDADSDGRETTYTLQLIPQLFMLPAPPQLGSPDVYPLNVPAWTLVFELLVNLIYVTIFRWLTTRVLIGVVIAAACLLTYTVLTMGTISGGSDWAGWWAGFGRAGFAFFAGVLCFRLVGSPKTADRPRSNWAIPLLLTLPIVCFVPASPEMRPFVDLFLALGLLMPLLLLSQSIAPPDRYTGILVFFGRLSYAIYILQQFLREAMDRILWKSTILQDIAPLGGIISLIVIVALSYWAEKYYDKPLRRWFVATLRERAKRKAATTAAVAG